MNFWEYQEIYNNNIAINETDSRETYYYKDLYKDISILKGFFERDKKELILLLVDNSYQSIVSYLSVLAANNAIMLIDQNIDPIFLKGLINNYEPDLVVAKKKLDYFEKRLDAMEEDINIIKKKILKLPQKKSGWLGGYWEINNTDD